MSLHSNLISRGNSKLLVKVVLLRLVGSVSAPHQGRPVEIQFWHRLIILRVLWLGVLKGATWCEGVDGVASQCESADGGGARRGASTATWSEKRTAYSKEEQVEERMHN